jgi:hypothetical protein
MPADAHPSPTVEYIRTHNMHRHPIKEADVEAAKKTGGMVALFPRTHDLDVLHVDGGEDTDELHMTVIFLGEDVTDQDPTELISQLDFVSDNYSSIEARVFAHALFNPDGEQPCAVYLVGDNIDIVDLYQDMKKFVDDRYPGSKEQHPVYTPHITAGYGLTVDKLDYTGPITFDRIGLRWPDHDQDWTL